MRDPEAHFSILLLGLVTENRAESWATQRAWSQTRAMDKQAKREESERDGRPEEQDKWKERVNQGPTGEGKYRGLGRSCSSCDLPRGLAQ